MDELQISGKRYISARRIARENGYTSDYIGQLIRGGKIVGQKVGRAWYVDAASFDRYLGSEAAPVPAPEPEALETQAVETPVVRMVVSEPVKVEEEPSAVEAVAEPAIAKEEMAEEVESIVESEEVPAAKEEPVIEETKIEIKPIPVAPAQPAPVQRIPLRISKKEETTTSTAKGLRYYADDEPSIPEITKSFNVSRITEAGADTHAEEAKEVRTTKSQARASRYGVGLVMAGVVIFIFAAVVSSAVTLNLSVREGNTAAASYGLSW